jgi:hypothetical protein
MRDAPWFPCAPRRGPFVPPASVLVDHRLHRVAAVAAVDAVIVTRGRGRGYALGDELPQHPHQVAQLHLGG